MIMSTSRATLRCMATTLLLLAAPGAIAQPGGRSADTPPAATSVREIRWEDLMPKDWDPFKDLRDIGKGNVVDGSPAALQRMKRLREVWDNAPVNPALDGQRVKLPGYVVPLEESKDGLKEFLLVPYFGACIHSPPPPANQIIHVVSAKPVKGYATMDTVWVTGALSLSRQESEMGVSGYRMLGASIARYTAPSGR